MKNLILLLSLVISFIAPQCTYSQSFTNIFGGDHNDSGAAICSTSDGNIVVAGSSFSFMTEGLDIYVVKFNTEGDTLWSIYIGRDTTDFDGFHSEESVAVIENEANEIIVCGTLHIVGASDYHATILHRISADGNILQTRIYEIMAADDMVEMDNGSYMICGTGFSGFAQPQAQVMMVDQNFDIQWSTQYTGSEVEDSGLDGICKVNENEYVVVGYVRGHDIYTGLLSGIDTLGNITWATELFNGIDEDILFTCVERYDENSVICAGVTGFFGYSKAPSIWKFNTSGERQWQYTNPASSGILEYRDVLLNEDGNIAACGRYDTTYWTDETVGLFTLLNADGEMLKSKLLHDTANVYFSAMTQLNGAYYLTGPHGTGGINNNVLLVRNNFFNTDSLCGLVNDYEGVSFGGTETFANYEPEFPLHAASQTPYNVRIGRGANVSEICSHFENFDVGIEESTANSEELIYPNPFMQSFNIESKQHITHVQIIDLNGRIIACELENNMISFPNSVSAGIYVLTYTLADGKSLVKKIVKE
ncbi:MAG: hypothetical protein ACI8ZM_001402 [Crocinitomix sp.]|jgi:hypothetical protein